MRHMLLRSCAGLLIIAIQVLIPQPARATSITVVSVDADNQGFNDPTPVDPVGGNAGTTLGAQRLIAAQFAADIWADLLSSNVPILIDAKFVPPNPNPPDPLIPADSLNRLNCDAARPVIATGDSITFHGNFKNAADKSPPIKNTWYPQALANSIAGLDLDSTKSDIRVYFNSSVGTADCLPNNDWYYGLDGSPPAGRFDFVTIALREIGHGLGFKTPVNLKTGAKLAGSNDVFSLNLKDISTGKLFSQMTDAERVLASKNTGNLRWIGAKVVAAHGGDMPMYAPADINPDFSVSNWDTSLQSGSVTIEAGSSTALITVTPIDDALEEGGETVILALNANAAYTVGAPSNATVIIADSDTPTPPTVSITANVPDASEIGPAAGQFTVTRTGDTTLPLTVNYVIGGTATNTTDYETLSGSVTIEAGSSTALITVTPIDDVLAEGTETVILTLRTKAAYTIGTPGKAMVTITDSDSSALPAVSITANQPNASEAGPSSGQFTVTRTGSTASDLKVNYTIGGTATNTTDNETLSGSVIIGKDSSTALIPVNPIDDALVEGDETVILTLSSGVYTVISPSSAIVTIADSDSTPTLPTVSITANQPNASEAGPSPGQFTVTRTGSTASSLTVNYTISGTATNGEDYAALPTSLAIDPPLYELLEPFYIAANHDVGLALQALEDMGWTLDPRPNGTVNVVASDATADEVGLTTGTFIIHRTVPTDQPLEVFFTVGGFATYGVDYQTTPVIPTPPTLSSVVIPAGEASVTITVTPLNDTVNKEGDETVTIQLQPDANTVTPAYTIGSPTSATVTIKDDVVFLENVNPPDGEVNVPYDYEIPVSGGVPPYTVTKTKGAPPAGLSLVPGDPPKISGTPTLAKTATFTFTVTDTWGASASNTVILKILKAVTITTKALKAATIGKAYVALLTVTGGKKNYTWSTEGGDPIPEGLSLDPISGGLGGTPAPGTAGTYNLRFKVTDSLTATHVKTLPLTVN